MSKTQLKKDDPFPGLMASLEYDLTIIKGVINTIKVEQPQNVSKVRKIYIETQAAQRKWIRKFINILYFGDINEKPITELKNEYNKHISPKIREIYEIAYPPEKGIEILPLLILIGEFLWENRQAIIDLLTNIFKSMKEADKEKRNKILSQFEELMWPPFDDDHVIYLYNKK